jgi:lipoic acid synthetase
LPEAGNPGPKVASARSSGVIPLREIQDGPPPAAVARGPGGPSLPGRRPSWLKVQLPGGEQYARLKGLLRGLGLHTVCEEARCPNLGECWGHGTATFLILGRVCTRACGFCAVETGRPAQADPEEPERVAEAVARLGLRHAVVTSVARDDLPDGGAAAFAATVRAIRARAPRTTVEVLIPDFGGEGEHLRRVLAAEPDVLNHNVETCRRLTPRVRARARYGRSLELLARARAWGPSRMRTKSGFMVGLGETWQECLEVMDDLRAARVDILTVGQYLRPSPRHLPLLRYYTPEEFDALRAEALSRGFLHCEAGPLVRSSYRAHTHVAPGPTPGLADPPAIPDNGEGAPSSIG